MPLVQVTLDLSDDIYKNIQDGTLQLMGMVKDGKNRIRKHIPQAKIPQTKQAAQVKKAGVFQIIKEHKTVAIGIGIATATIGAGAYAYHNWKERKKEEAEERISGFHKALKRYLKACKKGRLNTKVVNNLLDALNELETKKLGKDMELTISASQLSELIFSIFTYTEELAKANKFETKVKKPKTGSEGNIISLKSYLEIQKQILENAS